MNLISTIQRYIAVTSVGASTVRGSPKGTADAAREFLETIRLQRLGVSEPRVFIRRLDRLTVDLQKRLPRGRRHWGLARKILNIFLHNAFYNYYLRRDAGLAKAERLFEVPVDSAVAKGIRKALPERAVPRWRGLKAITPQEHALYQEWATEIARRHGITRVHLDAVLWTDER